MSLSLFFLLGTTEGPGCHRQSNRERPLEGAGGSDARGPEDQPGREPQICGLAQGSQQAAEKAANLKIPGDPNAKACSPA